MKYLNYEVDPQTRILDAPCGCYAHDEGEPLTGHPFCDQSPADLVVAEADGKVERELRESAWRWVMPAMYIARENQTGRRVGGPATAEEFAARKAGQRAVYGSAADEPGGPNDYRLVCVEDDRRRFQAAQDVEETIRSCQERTGTFAEWEAEQRS